MKTCITILFLANSLLALSQVHTCSHTVPCTSAISVEKQLLNNYAGLSGPAPVQKPDPLEGSTYVRAAFMFYKSFISSQDHMSCVFTPSCSEYAVQAIQKQGIFLGMLNTFDRLTRCNGLRPGDYTIDPRVRLLVDPVRNIRYEAL